MKKTPGLGLIGIFLIVLFGVLTTGIGVLKTAPHMPLLICTVLMAIFLMVHGASWKTIEEGMIEGISKGLKPILILSLIGILIGVWMASGTVPFLVFWGFNWINPDWFLVTALLGSMLVSTFTGSSFTTVGTIGAALMGIGLGFGINPAMCAGAIICGACFGDKMSPLSDTTNFAPAVAGTDLYKHIRHMVWTTVPAISITFIIFLFIGRHTGADMNMEAIQTAIATLEKHFNLSWLTLISPLLVVIAAFRKLPILPVLILGIVTGGLTFVLLQPNATVATLFQTMQGGFPLETGNPAIDNIISRGGLMSMMFSVSLIIIALSFGGMAYKAGFIDAFLNSIVNRMTQRGHYVTAATFSSIGVNILTGEQYLSILLPGQAYKDSFEQKHIPNETLSRSLEDGGTLVNPLIPWGVSGAFFASTLGVPVIEYLPFVFFLYLSPIFTILMAYLPKVKNHTLHYKQELKVS